MAFPAKIQGRVGLCVTIFCYRKRIFTPIPNASVPPIIIRSTKNTSLPPGHLTSFRCVRFVNYTLLAHSAGSLSAINSSLRMTIQQQPKAAAQSLARAAASKPFFNKVAHAFLFIAPPLRSIAKYLGLICLRLQQPSK